MTLGVVSAVGSLGTLVFPIVTQTLLTNHPWQHPGMAVRG